jgi:SAM-dependent methyltransferase
MQVHQASLRSTARYLETEGARSLETYEELFQKFQRLAGPFHPVTAKTRVLEVGIGTGGFLVVCAQHGLRCVGLEISPQLIEFAHERAARHGVSLDLRLGNIEDAVLDPGAFDVVIADSVFEHVENWQRGLANVAASLRPGGVLIFSSTNRFALWSGEFPQLPFYGWLPDRVRYWLRQVVEGPDVMRLGIDFHQFTYRTLRRGLADVGFSRVYDIADLLNPERLNHPTRWKVALTRAMRRSPAVRRAVLTFWPGTELVAVKS